MKIFVMRFLVEDSDAEAIGNILENPVIVDLKIVDRANNNVVIINEMAAESWDMEEAE